MYIYDILFNLMAVQSVTEFLGRFKNMIGAFQSERTDIVLNAANDAIQAALDRVINTGELADGRKVQYAESTKKQKERKRQTRSPFPFINFSDTNRMWASTSTKILSNNEGQIVLSVSATGDREDVMGYHEERFEISLVALNELEQQQVIEDFQTNFQEFLNKYLN